MRTPGSPAWPVGSAARATPRSVTVSGSTGGGVFYGGSAGGNHLTAGAGVATLVGGGAGDVLTAGPREAT